MHKRYFFIHWLFNSELILDFRKKICHVWPKRFYSKDVLNGVLYRKPFYKQRQNYWAGVGDSFSPNKGQLNFPKKTTAFFKILFSSTSSQMHTQIAEVFSNRDTSSLRRGDNEIWRKQWKLLNDELISAIFFWCQMKTYNHAPSAKLPCTSLY